MAGKTLSITYTADSAKVLAAQRSIDAGNTKLEGGVSSIGKSLSTTFGITGPLAIAAAGAAIGKFAFDSINAASDLNESANKARVTFGQSAQAVEHFGDTAAQSFGISKQAALEASSGFGNILQTSGVVQDQAADMSVSLVKLAGDMASFNNIEPAEALEKLRSGLVGEAEPLRTVGVLLSETRVAQEAYRSGIAATGTELTDAQKVQARYNIIMQDTAKQQGDFGRTSDGLANQTRILKAEFEDLQAEIGQKLLPVVISLFHALNDLLGMIENLGKAAGESLGKPLADVTEKFAGLAQQQLDNVPAMEALGYQLQQQGGLAGELGDKILGTAKSMREGVAAQNALSGASEKGGKAAEDNAKSQADLAAEHKAAAQAARDQRDAELSLAGGLLGLVSDLDDLSEAQDEVNKLKRQGKTNTDAYHEAVLGAAEAAVRFRSDIADLYSEQKDANATTQDGVRTLIDIGRQFGLTRKDLTDLLGPLSDYVRGIDDIPRNVSTNVRANTGQASAAIENLAAKLAALSGTTVIDIRTGVTAGRQHGGPVSAGSPYVVGEAGPELFVPNTSGRIVPNGGAGVTLNVYVGGSVTAERDLVETIRDALARTARYNPDIFGGRA